VLEILELQGVVAGSLGQTPKATKFFEQLLSLDFDHKLEGDHPPRVMTPLYEAKSRVAEQGPLDVKPNPVVRAKGKVTSVGLRILNDTYKLVKAVSFHVRADNGAWVTTKLEPVKGASAVNLKAAKVDWWAELLNENEATIAQLGWEQKPLHEDGEPPPPVVAVVETPKVEPKALPAPAPAVVAPAPISLRPASYVIAGVGAASLIGGVVMGLRANGLKNQADHPQLDPAGRVTGRSQQEGFDLDAQQRTAATVANGLLIGGGVLAATGVLFFLVGGSSSSTQVAIAPSPGGVRVTGGF
jgi:hypothetical protein